MGLQTMSSNQQGEGKSFLKWAGGKTRYADQLAAIAPPSYGRYFEPFMGSAALFFELGHADSSLSDANPELVICFQQVAKDPEKIMALLDDMPNTREFYNAERSKDPDTLSDFDRAARVIYLNKTGFRGLWRVNRKGGFNVPYGEYDRPYYNRSTLLAASAALKSAEIQHRDFEVALKDAAPGDWVYLDPPYIPLSQFSDFKRYTAGQFGEEDQRRLASAMLEASSRGVHVTMTNSDTPIALEIFSNFHVARMATRRDINLQSQSRGSWDLVFTNYECSLPEQSKATPLIRTAPSERKDLALFNLPEQGDAPKASEVRAWARGIGLEVSARGRLRPEIIAAWRAARSEGKTGS
ncbi:Dam family site-specific DNA-(adenine-N6)-methyltransferase [Streptomyces sp. TRM75563]|uniref:Dam family site-specific DNA-(adenine-N6)-methyltransferase n=1 Tax=Streptomyces sp. TRM75563 TaxID=2817418 RepID=UPI001F61D1AC|nr:Dam family site-specific DNA-(adenine-N6)-methyltransferase [Streptomyces sp. TRM75563]MCI4040014.1 Dam family site-specific DNA-(adenine-N6)-methyltransferase [Streptomyces sp. TRM75563]